MAEKMEQDLENNPVPLENLEIKEDGTVELDVPNPCTLRKPSG
jgi:hypothetical protein